MAYHRRHSTATQTPAQRQLAAVLAPGQHLLRQAAMLSVIAGLLWPLQAFAVAIALGRLLSGTDLNGLWVAAVFVALGVIRAALVYLAEGRTDRATEIILQTARRSITGIEAQRASDSPFGGAGSISALASEKLDLLAPYVSRYAPARARVIVLPLVILAVTAWHSWAVAIILMISGPLIPVFMALVGLAAKEASRRQMTEIGSLNDQLVERLSALVDIRLLGATDRVTAGFAAQAQDLRQRTMATLRIAFLSSTVLELFSAIGVAMVAVYVGFSLLGVLNFGAWDGGLSPVSGIFLLLLAPEFFQPLRDLSAAWHDKAAAEAVANDLARWTAAKTQRMIGDGAQVPPLPGPASLSIKGCSLPNGVMLPDIDIAAGESVALVGPSGSGKTTILRLLAGLHCSDRGRVIVAGHPLTAQIADAWRARLGWMAQSPHFFNASLRQNLTLGRTGTLDAALERASVADVVAALPNGLGHRLGETGGGLSGGEARRLTLARAVFAAPDVILADEPTADLDAKTARLVTAGLLAEVRRGATLVVATHDPVLAAQMGRIIRLDRDT